MPKLKWEEKQKDEENAKVSSLSVACSNLGVRAGASKAQLKRAWIDGQKKWHIDKWRTNTVSKNGCGGECGLKPREEEELWFHSEKCKEHYRKYDRNLQRVNNSYDLLTGKRSPEPDQPDQTDPSPCDHCKKPTYGKFYSEFKQKQDEKGNTINYLFCSADCYNKFPIPSQNNSKICCECGGPVGDSNWINEWSLPICISCASVKCQECNKQGIPSKGSGWVGYHQDGWFCCQEHYKKWKGKQNQEQESEEDISPELPQPTSRPINRNRGEENRNEQSENDSDNDNYNNDSGYNSDNNSNDSIPNQNENGKGNSELPKDIQKIVNAPLPQAKQQAEQKIEEMLQKNGISEQELNAKNPLGQSNWKDFLSKLDSPQAVAEFVQQMQKVILKEALAKNISANQGEEKKPKDGWIKPTVIVILSLLVLSTLIIIIRKRRKKSF